MPNKTGQRDAPVSFVHPKRATIAPPSSTQQNGYHFLNWPVEVRLGVWSIVINDFANDRVEWFAKPQRGSELEPRGFRSLFLVCRQVYHELQTIGYRHVVPWNRFSTLVKEPWNPTNIQVVKSVSFDMRLDANAKCYTDLSAFLWKATPHLKELRLYFTGPDLYGNRVHSHGCGNLSHDEREPTLSIGGQRHSDLLPLWKRICKLDKLETLVITNANYQTYIPMFLINKPWLKHLYLSADPRSTIHQRLDIRELNRLIRALPDHRRLPPIKVLKVSANASVSSHLIVNWSAPTLEHLTWTIPDPSLQSGPRVIDWYQYTYGLMQTLALNAKKLRTLRICVGGPGIWAHDSEGMFHGALNQFLPTLNALDHFEIHLKSRSFWFGKQILARLPQRLQHIYLSDRTIHHIDLMHQVWQRYLVADTDTPASPIHADVAYIRGGSERPMQTTHSCNHKSMKLVLPAEPYDTCAIDPITFRYVETMTKEDQGAYYITRYKQVEATDGASFVPGYCHDRDYIAAYRTDLSPSDVIGENLGRHDCIPLNSGRLRFVHYEYDNPDVDSQEDMGNGAATILQTLLLVNGRLLDRHRNQHLAIHGRGAFVPVQVKLRNDEEVETSTRSANLPYSVLLHKLKELGQSDYERRFRAEAEMKNSKFHRDFGEYFGNEDDAVRVFREEPVARNCGLEPLTHVVEKEVYVDGKCHWSSPEALQDDTDLCDLYA